MVYQRNPRKRIIRGRSADELRRGGRRTSEELDVEGEEMPFVRLGSSVIGTVQDVVQRIGNAIIGGDFGGNARGRSAVDIQIERSANDQVASGDVSLAFGRYVKASGLAAIGIGENVTASGVNAIAIGGEAFATATDSLVLGQGTASGSASIAVGMGDVTASGADSVAVGVSATAIAARAIGIGPNAQAENVDEAIIRALTIRMQTGSRSPGNPDGTYEPVITTSAASPVTGNVTTWADVDRIGDGGVALSALAPLASPSFTGVVGLPQGGTAATPVLAFTGDLNTGFYRVSADRAALVANGQVCLTVDGTSGVGLVESASVTAHARAVASFRG